MKWMSRPSIPVRKCGTAFSLASTRPGRPRCPVVGQPLDRRQLPPGRRVVHGLPLGPAGRRNRRRSSASPIRRTRPGTGGRRPLSWRCPAGEARVRRGAPGHRRFLSSGRGTTPFLGVSTTGKRGRESRHSRAALASATGRWKWSVPPAGYSGSPATGSPGSTRSSWPRELMSSFVKTLPRWYWTVRALMNSRAADLRVGQSLDGQPRDQRSCAVRSAGLPAVRLRAVSPVARSSSRARSANASSPIASNSVMGGAQPLPGVDAPTLRGAATRRRGVGRGRARRGAGSGRDGRRPRGRRSASLPWLSRARDRASIPSAHSVRRRPPSFGQPVERGSRSAAVAGPGGRLDQLGTPGPNPVGRARGPAGGGAGQAVATLAVASTARV